MIQPQLFSLDTRARDILIREFMLAGHPYDDAKRKTEQSFSGEKLPGLAVWAREEAEREKCRSR